MEETAGDVSAAVTRNRVVEGEKGCGGRPRETWAKEAPTRQM